jgi:two-component system, NtrC family, C4-dicarboxylate transport response regulator DctD
MRPKILIVEDRSQVRRFFELLLCDDYEVVCTETANKALKIFSQVKPDLMITNYLLPGMSGLEMIKHLRLAGNTFPIMIISDVDVEEQAKKVGACCFFLQPFDTSTLLDGIKRCLEKP